MSRIIVLFFYLALVSAVTSKTLLHVALFLPSYESKEALSYQTQRLLSSGYQAANEVNNCTDVLNSYSLELIPILTLESNTYKAVIEFYDLLLSPEVKLVGIVGQMDRSLARLLLPIADQLGITQVVDLVSDTNKSRHPNLYTPVPSLSLHIEAAVYLLVDKQWPRVGLLHTDGPVHLGAAHRFLSLVKELHAGVEVSLIRVEPNSINDTLNLLEDSESFVFLSLLPLPLSSHVISGAEQRGLLYVWILLEYEPNSDVSFPSENALIFRYLFNSTNISPGPEVCVSVTGTQNFVYRSLWVLSTALNSSTRSFGSLYNIPGKMDNMSQLISKELDTSPFVRNYAYVDQTLEILSNDSRSVGYFDSQTKKISLNVTFDVPGLQENISRNYVLFPPEVVQFTVAVTCICFALTTLLLLLFVCFRKEPEIKASSVSLSLLMFLGCYLILSGALTLFVSNGFILLSHSARIARCNIEIYFVAVGVDIILTTLLVKVLRVWRIFALHGRTGRFWKDYSLLCFIGVVVGGKIVLLVIWIAVDSYNLEDIDRLVRKDGRSVLYNTVQQCQSRDYFVWLGLVYGYSIVIGLILIFVSIMTRKIKQENFKDTKKVSIYTTSCTILAIVCGSLWALLRFSGDSVGSKLAIGAMYCCLVLFSELFLFLPKILAPLLRRLNLAPAYENEMKLSSVKSPTLRPLSVIIDSFIKN